MSWEDDVLTEDYMDEDYVLNVQNPIQLISSLAFFLRERNYISLYDTSILSSPEKYLKKHSVDEINKDYLYKWFLFFTGILRHLSSFDNLVLLPEVATEIRNILNATISAIEKRKTQYKSLSSQDRESYTQVYQQLIKNEDVLTSILRQIDAKNFQQVSQISIFKSILEVIKFLNTHLGLKKPDSRLVNDTDERIAARTFYEVIINGSNVSVYTRDDDIRKLISVTFRLLISKFINKGPFKKLLRNLSHINIIVLKYNYEKKVFSRFFESSTLENAEEFKFSRKIAQYSNVGNILNDMETLLNKVCEELENHNIEEDSIEEVIQEEIGSEQMVESLQEIFNNLYEMETRSDDAKSNRKKIFIFQELSFLVKSLGNSHFAEEIMDATKQQQKGWMENHLKVIMERKVVLQSCFAELSEKMKENMDYTLIKAIKKNICDLQENLLKSNFYKCALDNNFYHLDEEHYSQFTDIIAQFQKHGFEIDCIETPVPIEKIAQISKYSTSEIIKIIEKYGISHQGTHAYLSQKNILFFLVDT